jgi:hypothetical protein
MVEITNKPSENIPLKFLRWTARITAILIAAFCLLMFFGEGIQDHSPNAIPLVTRDYIILSLWALFIIGLIIGLWWEGLGGLISLVFMVTHIVILQIEKGIPVIFYFLLVPGILYLLSWFYHRRLKWEI